MKINAAGLEIIKQFEGLKDGDPNTPGLQPYVDPVGVLTIGYGHAIVDSGRQLKGSIAADKARAYELFPGITEPEAEALLRRDVEARERSVRRLTQGIDLNSNQFSALVSLVFNIGEGNFSGSTLLKHLRDGDFQAAADEFPKWRRADGQILEGLVRRREAERQLFLKPVKPLSKSRTMAGVGAAGAAQALSEVVAEVEPINTALQSAGIEITMITMALGIATAAGLALAAYARWSDSREGRT